MTKDKAWGLAQQWIEAWNSHDLDRIMALYDDSVELTSPVAARLLDGNGTVQGKENVRAYFQRGLQAYPELAFDLKNVLWGVKSVVLYYESHKSKTQEPSHTAEFMELSDAEKIVLVVANYDAP